MQCLVTSVTLSNIILMKLDKSQFDEVLANAPKASPENL